jgi:hypothetical protein
MARGEIMLRGKTIASIVAAILTGVLGLWGPGFLPLLGARGGTDAHACDAGDAAPSAWRCLNVAPHGRDQNPGTLDAPFATIMAAKARARTFGDNWRGDVIIAIRGGTYYLRQALVSSRPTQGRTDIAWDTLYTPNQPRSA